MIRAVLIVFLVSTAACGDDSGGGAKPPPKPAAQKGGAGKKPEKKVATLNVYPKVEERVPVDERATIRHAFRERDFASDPTGSENRDPFRSYLINQPGTLDTTNNTAQTEVTEFCKNKKQMVAVNYSLRDLRLVGIVARGTRKFALFQDTGGAGRIVHRGDCLGREKARVKDIGAGFVTLEIIPEQIANQPSRPTEERSIPLYPDELKLEDLENQNEGEPPASTTTPAMPPSGSTTTGPVMPTDPAPTTP